MHVIICGGREQQLTKADIAWLDTLGIAKVLHGDATGIDRDAEAWARDRQIPVQAYPAAWEAQGRAAGPRRNATMLADLLATRTFECTPVAVCAFPGGRGTADMVSKATNAGVTVLTPPQEGVSHG